VTVLDACGGPLAGVTVALSVSGSGNSVTQPASATDAGGVATGSFSSTVAQSKTVSASANGTAVAQQATVSVTAPPVAVHFTGLTGAKTSQSKRNWQATATVTVANAGGGAVSGARATLGLSGGAAGTVSCTTGSSGQCSASVTLKNQNASVTFTEQSIQGTGMTYDPGANVGANAVTVVR
jgi:adhesin/invasin